MINVITLISYTGEQIVMALRRPELSGFLVMSPEGLGPVSSDISTVSSPSGDGHYFKSSSVDTRTVKLPIVFWEDNNLGQNIEQLRFKMERLFRSKSEVYIVVESGTDEGNPSRVGVLKGYVEENEVAFFTNQVGTTLSIKCPDPWYHKTSYRATHEYVAADYDTTFTETGSVSSNVYTASCTYDGDIPAGLVFEIKVSAASMDKAVLIFQTAPSVDSDRYVRLETHRGSNRVTTNDKIYLSTIRRHKYIRKGSMDASGVNLINYYAGSSDYWPEVNDVGPNHTNTFTLEIPNESASECISEFKIHYMVLYGGM